MFLISIKLNKYVIKLFFDPYPSTTKFVPECFMTQEMCNKAVNRCFFVFDFIPD